jgi:hypothetical protein
MNTFIEYLSWVILPLTIIMFIISIIVALINNKKIRSGVKQ